MAKLVIANQVRIGSLGGVRLQTDAFHAFPHLIRVATVVDFAAYVPGPSSEVHLGWVEWRVKGCKNGVKAEQNNGKTWKA